MLAAVRAGYNMMRSGKTREVQSRPTLDARFEYQLTCAQLRSRVIGLIQLFFETLTSKAEWNRAVEAGICSIPLSEDWQTRRFVTQFVPLWTRQRYNYYLMFHLELAGMCTAPIDPPTVPRGTGRVRLVIHASNTEAQIHKLAISICEWAQEMLEIENTSGNSGKIPTATSQVYSLMAAYDVHPLNPAKAVSHPLVVD